MMRGVIGGLMLALLASTAAAEVRQETRAVQGLRAPAELIVDRWGIPHIYAKSSRDAFFLQGYNAARDRLWQIDLWRKRGLGRLSASLGPAYVAQDRAARLFLYRGDMAAEWAAYDPGGKEAVESFAAGVNAYVAEVRAGKRPLPVEFKLTSSQPEDWKPQEILQIRSHALVSNVTSEVARARVVCAGGVEADALRRKLEPAHKLAVPKGLDPCDVPANVLDDYTRATEAVSFKLQTAKTAEAEAPKALAQVIDERAAEGSNNWVISAARSATGRPILANDPHRPVGAPSLRYIAHLDAPGLSIIGAGEPALPGVSFGHNGTTAFGLTIFYIDQEDLYVYETQGNAYRYKGAWEPMTVVKDTIEVKGEAPRPVELHYTRHGPVLAQDDAKGRAFALRTIWNEPGLAGYFGSSRMWHAKGWDDFQTARNKWGAPPLNLVYADTKGETGWSAAGRTPVRPNWDGLMPVPGDGSYEWKGFVEDGGLPVSRNPKAGYFATANAMNIPAEPAYPRETRKLGFEWADPTRTIRIHEVLDALPKSTLADSMALQTDSVSPQARRGVALLRTLDSSPDPNIARALTVLKAWDGAETTDSVAATIYETWAVKHLGAYAVLAAKQPAPVRKLIGASSPDPILTWLEAQPPAVRNPVMISSLADALSELRGRLGSDMTTWTWGRVHPARFVPAIATLADPQLAAQMSVGPLPVPGSSSTPRAATWKAEDFTQIAGASVRLVMDVGAWDNSMAINTPGQSGDPASPHYRDLFPLWAAGAYVPLRFSRAAVEADAETVMTLTPAP
ncbi:MAG: penicillin acylase family protein [Alphaproteobacteria bacterium]|nr:penicillin acylase family protein [Alphaproteobacteria bacterium]MBU1515860.1 penicillin acylase family protein [Alphaproteobacteria bacterium]MBU2094082.1 penicillin acylase family protein [Alphaproteobacteria bacterium]MBU2151434.1 penicillin acylase family protein [Alphaproteobacteria bacterium]MBU2305290.1 penicillin acylase family protein [Alphaproteobacteria bacterium]